MFKDIESVSTPCTGECRCVLKTEAVVNTAMAASPKKRQLSAEWLHPTQLVNFIQHSTHSAWNVFRHYVICRNGSYSVFITTVTTGKPHGHGIPLGWHITSLRKRRVTDLRAKILSAFEKKIILRCKITHGRYMVKTSIFLVSIYKLLKNK